MQKFPFDLGRAFPTLSSFLTVSDKLSLATSCHLLRDLLLQSHTWHQFSINDYDSKNWSHYMKWVSKYIDLIQPSRLVINILEEEHEKENQFVNIFKKKRQNIQKVQLRCQTPQFHLIIAHSCPSMTSINLSSAIASDALLTVMLKHCPQVRQIQINADSLQFRGQGLKNYLSSPLSKLVLKPYQLDYQQLIDLFSDNFLNQINELEIDMQQCSQKQLAIIMINLPHLKRLRLFHMQKYEDPQIIASGMNQEIVELTLTKCYHLSLKTVVTKIATPHLQRIDFTEALHLKDTDVTFIASRANNLQFLNISWCNEITNHSLRQIVSHCLQLQTLIVNGIKSLNDHSFDEYQNLKQTFDQKLYDEIRFQFKKKAKMHRKNIDQLYDQLQPQVQKMTSPLATPLKTLRNLRHLECNSCNNISDTILKVIYCLNRTSKVINYYGQTLSLYHISQLSQDQYF